MPGFGPVRFSAWQVQLAPDALASGLRALDARLGVEPDALGPLSAAWLRARAALVDLLSDLAPKGGLSADLLASWGLVPDAVLRFSLGAAGGTDAGRHLLAVAAGLSEAPVTTPLWHARFEGRVRDAAAVETALYTLASKMRWPTLNPRTLPAAFGEPAPANVFWMAFAADQGLVIVARRQVDLLAIDLIAGTADLEPSTIWGWLQAEAGPDDPVGFGDASGGAPARFILDFGGLAALEVALNVASTLAPRPGATPAMRQSLAEAGAALTASCVDRWQRTADLAQSVRVEVDPGAAVADDPRRSAVVIEAHLTPEGAAAWALAARPLPLTHLDGWPAAWQLGLAGAGFPPFDSQATGLAGWLQARGCSGGDPGTLALGAWVHLPSILAPSGLPRPEPPGGDASNLDPVIGAAAAVVGMREGLGARGLGLAGVQRGTVIATTSPLGPDAQPEAGGGVQLQAPGQAPVVWRLREGAAAQPGSPVEPAVTILGLGQGTADDVQARLRGPTAAHPSESRLFAEARVDATALAAVLSEAGEAGASVAALRAVGTRLGAWRLAATLTGDRVAVRLGPEKRAVQAGQHLDVRLGAK